MNCFSEDIKSHSNCYLRYLYSFVCVIIFFSNFLLFLPFPLSLLPLHFLHPSSSSSSTLILLIILILSPPQYPITNVLFNESLDFNWDLALCSDLRGSNRES